MSRHPGSTGRTGPLRVVLADRGDALTGYLSAALAEQTQVVGRIDAELSRAERLLVAAATFRPDRRAWAERFFKSDLAVRLRSRRAERALRALAADGTSYDVVVQTHALFVLDDPRTVLYVDCTHRQSMEHWPDWNPLTGRALQRWLDRERAQYHRAAHVLAFSEATRRSLVEEYDVPAERVAVVGAGANVAELPTASPYPAEPAILFVGNDFVRKGGEALLQAFALVRAQVPAATLTLVGTSYAVPSEGLPDGVEVVGRVHDRAEMDRLYERSAVLALPSTFDPFPLVVLEAMAHARPVVATRQCGVPEMVLDGVTGTLVEPGADLVPRLAAQLVDLLRRPEHAAALGRAGRAAVEREHRWSHVVTRIRHAVGDLAAAPDRFGVVAAVHPLTSAQPARSLGGES
ncbi:glycosyltransferase family 4 protein [Lapillicoccus jejuensis]|uniref:D-inositol 3-phosphate glycosyltransferase n=1 Tax=Lapillicoccus jejuensis TaxID=402171 RepID=A0A542E024_9MICO|nr:glycosyltransferase family 4 protein [Lapillicoccus jejuensis]TQJ08685.1 glycosyltransferase involved in cell wall biosynthesis [Lapillicoccus jejuensis]